MGADRYRAVFEISRKQHVVVARRQLLAAGLSRHTVDRLVKSGLLRSLYQGIYLVGPAATARSYEMAAVLACGDRALLSHDSAAHAWDLLPYPASKTVVHVTVVGTDRRPGPGIRVHRVRSLMRSEVTRLERIPITTPARTLLDIAGTATPGELELAVARAESKRLASRPRLIALLARHPTQRGARVLRELVASDGRPSLTRSEAERRFLDLVRRTDLPRPDANVRLGEYEVDFLWRDERLVVEIDGFRFHSSRSSFEADRRRDSALAASGFSVVRITWRQLVDAPEATLVRLAQTLAARVRPAES